MNCRGDRHDSASFAPLGLARFPTSHPRLAPWAVSLRRFAAVLLDVIAVLEISATLENGW